MALRQASELNASQYSCWAMGIDWIMVWLREASVEATLGLIWPWATAEKRRAMAELRSQAESNLLKGRKICPHRPAWRRGLRLLFGRRSSRDAGGRSAAECSTGGHRQS